VFRPISQLCARPVEWLWPLHLALGKLAILEGDPGLGKSFLALDLVARLTTGRPWPDGSPGGPPAHAVVLNAEDDNQDTVRPRLEALGADLDRVIVHEPRVLLAPGPLCLSRAIRLLETELTRTQARLVVLDPIVAFLDEHVRIHSELSVRRALFPSLFLTTFS
jgi:RecA-family ATPase